MNPLSSRIREISRMTGVQFANLMEVWADEVERMEKHPRDEHHTMSEMYQYRAVLHAHAAHGWMEQGAQVVRSWRHHTGELCFGGGWFIVTASLAGGRQVSNHYEASNWDLFHAVPEVEQPPEWDGHSPTVALERLRESIIEGSHRG